jgi:glutamate/tyrosine decarboxylase-like PLP-dependent enzyme
VVTSAGRYFGFVEGDIIPAALAADWLTSAWDQNPAFFVLSPAAATAEQVCRRWLLICLARVHHGLRWPTSQDSPSERVTS